MVNILHIKKMKKLFKIFAIMVVILPWIGLVIQTDLSRLPSGFPHATPPSVTQEWIGNAMILVGGLSVTAIFLFMTGCLFVRLIFSGRPERRDP